MFTYKGQRRQWNPQYLGLINHFVYVVDMSMSMKYLRSAVAQFLTAQREILARKSEEQRQETRISVYLFSDDVECVLYDQDVLRPVDFDALLTVNGWTALRDATMLAARELEQTAAIHGDHAFVLNVITDGDENSSRTASALDVTRMIERLSTNWSITCFVPDGGGYVDMAVRKGGFPASHVQTWDVSVEGVQRLGQTFTRAADTYFTGRSTGTRSFTSKALFGGGEDALNDTTVAQAGLVEVDPARFAVFTLSERIEAKPFCEQKGYRYHNGVVYYEWFNTQDIQPQKVVLFQRIRDGKVYSAPMGSQAARDLLGLLPGMLTRGKPAPNKEWRRFIQSTAPNRKLIPGKHALVLDATLMSPMAMAARG